MHQHPRRSPSAATPPASPGRAFSRSSTSERTHEENSEGSSSEEELTGISEGIRAMVRIQEASDQGRETIAKLSQIVQNYFVKAALLILHARVPLPPSYNKETRTRRVNKWFNVELDETDIIREDVRTWRLSNVTSNRPSPMIIETYIDIQDLGKKQCLVVVDEQGRRWDVEDALNSSPESVEDSSHSLSREVVLERWVVQLGEPSGDMPADIAPTLPKTYKNSIVLFRSLFTCARLLPAWKLGKRLFSPRPSASIPKVKHRILQVQDLRQRSNDPLAVPLYVGQENVFEKFSFDPVDTPAGAFSMQATYRTNCDFQIDDSEEFLSSRFMGMDEKTFEPSLARRQGPDSQPGHQRTVSAEVGSLPSRREDFGSRPDPGQAYGSLSTFHQAGALGASPISALRAAQVAGSESPEDTVIRKGPPNLRSGQGSRSSLRSADGGQGVGRRPSVSFMPFKSPALSSSPEPQSATVQRNSLGKNSPLATLAEARHPAQARPTSRGSPIANEATAPSGTSGSPRPQPASRFSSSFGHRKSKLSAGGSKTEDEVSSGKASVVSSNAQPGSGVLAEGDTSSGSMQADDENISDFLKLLEQKKDLQSFQPLNDRPRTNAALQKFKRMRDSNMALSDSISSSLVLQRSSTSSSQKISSVPAMVAGTSMSVSTSPGKPISPHTPHTPAIPSRLSANSIVAYSGEPSTVEEMADDVENEASEQTAQPFPDLNSGAIAIPTSPRPYRPPFRRPSSAAQRRQISTDEDDVFPFGMRSASLGVNDDRAPISRSTLVQGGEAQTATETADQVRQRTDPVYGPMYEASPESGSGPERSTPAPREDNTSTRSRSSPYRPRIGRGSAGRGETPPQASSSSLVEKGSGSGSSEVRGGRYNTSRRTSHYEDDEPLFFAMSDIAATQQSRRSFDDSRGTGPAGDSASSSRQGSRRTG